MTILIFLFCIAGVLENLGILDTTDPSDSNKLNLDDFG